MSYFLFDKRGLAPSHILFSGEFEEGVLGIGLPRIQASRGKAWLVRRIREVLGFQGKPAPMLIRLAPFTLHRTIEEVAGIELHTRFAGVELQAPA